MDGKGKKIEKVARAAANIERVVLEQFKEEMKRREGKDVDLKGPGAQRVVWLDEMGEPAEMASFKKDAEGGGVEMKKKIIAVSDAAVAGKRVDSAKRTPTSNNVKKAVDKGLVNKAPALAAKKKTAGIQSNTMPDSDKPVSKVKQKDIEFEYPPGLWGTLMTWTSEFGRSIHFFNHDEYM